MSTHLNEQEQVDLIKKFWKSYGFVIIGAIVVVGLAMAGWRYWQGHESDIARQASTLYQMELVSAQKGHDNLVAVNAKSLRDKYPSSTYASLGSLLSAKQLVKAGKLRLALADLQWVTEHSNSKQISDIASLRTAQILLDLKQAKHALQILQPKSTAYISGFDNLKGDAYLQLGQIDKARKSYQSALNKLAKTNPIYDMVAMKLYALPLTQTK